jgi:opacity protein-like surface antigen
MKKLVLVAVFLLGFSVMAMAQDAPKVEVFGGYSLVLVDTATALKQSLFGGMDLNLNGWNGSIAFNGNKWAGFVADFGGYYGVVGEEHSNPVRWGEWMDVTIHSVMFGPKFTLHRGAVSPFVQSLFGVARIKGSWAHNDYIENDFAMALGGGIDVNLSSKVAIRPVQLDYFLTKTGHNGDLADHLRFSTGVVLKLGKR